MVEGGGIYEKMGRWNDRGAKRISLSGVMLLQ